MKNKIDKISVITTYYNTNNKIIQCLNSVMRQKKYDNYDIEYVIVNDCSTDNTEEIVNLFLKMFIKENPECDIDVKHIKTDHNLGRGGARRLGIETSSGNYLMFLDSDDHYLNNDLIYRCHELTPIEADIIEFGIKYIDNNCDAHNLFIKSSQTLYNNGTGNLIYLFYEDNIKFMPWTKMIKRSLIETHQWSDDREYDDLLTIPYLIYNANKIIIMPWVEIIYKPSYVSKDPNETHYKTVKAIASLFDDFKDNKSILKAMYQRCLVDMRSILNLDSTNEYFRKMMKLNNKMLKYISPKYIN